MKRVATTGGRGYMVGPNHELYQDVISWGGVAAVLYRPLERCEPAPPSPVDALDELAATRAELQGGLEDDRPFGNKADSTGPSGMSAAHGEEYPLQVSAEEADSGPKGMAPVAPVDPEKDLRRLLKGLGKKESLQDSQAIPMVAAQIRQRYLVELSSATVFIVCSDAFAAARVVAHRKAIVYVAHELFTRQRAVMRAEDRLVHCLRCFLKPIGKTIRALKADEREAYCRLVAAWEKAKVFQPDELAELKEAWDVD